MGCKQITKMRKHSYISDIKGRPIEDILDRTIYVGNIPDFVNEFIYHINLTQCYVHINSHRTKPFIINLTQCYVHINSHRTFRRVSTSQNKKM